MYIYGRNEEGGEGMWVWRSRSKVKVSGVKARMDHIRLEGGGSRGRDTLKKHETTRATSQS